MGRSAEVMRAAVRFLQKGNSVEETCDAFGASERELKHWLKLYEKTGDVTAKKQFIKIDPDVLKQTLKENPDITKKELAQKFDCRISSIEKALVRIGYKEKLKTSNYIPPEPVNIQKLKEYIATHPTATVRDISLALDRSQTAINRAIKKHNIPYTKKTKSRKDSR